jgi:hypothetical protein
MDPFPMGPPDGGPHHGSAGSRSRVLQAGRITYRFFFL